MKSLGEFYRQKTCRGGYRPACKACSLKEMAESRAEKMADPAFSARRREQMRVASRRKYEALDDEGRFRQRAWTEDWRSRNREAVAEQYRRWRLANPDKVRAKNQRRRARLLDAFVAPVDPQEIWDRDGGICQLCKEPVDPRIEWPGRMSKTLDHVVPLANGGTHEPSNVQLAHAVCNSRKNNRAA